MLLPAPWADAHRKRRPSRSREPSFSELGYVDKSWLGALASSMLSYIYIYMPRVFLDGFTQLSWVAGAFVPACHLARCRSWSSQVSSLRGQRTHKNSEHFGCSARKLLAGSGKHNSPQITWYGCFGWSLPAQLAGFGPFGQGSGTDLNSH
eukprot:1525411-Pyramimonas_sp.AAC.1